MTSTKEQEAQRNCTESAQTPDAWLWVNPDGSKEATFTPPEQDGELSTAMALAMGREPEPLYKQVGQSALDAEEHYCALFRDAARYQALRSLDDRRFAVFEMSAEGTPNPTGILVGGHLDNALDAILGTSTRA
jgi:hypothetical protein